MNERSLRKFLRALSVPDITKRGDWLNFHCVLAPATHENGDDSTPSAGVSICNDGPSYYYCFGCQPEPLRLDDLCFSVWLNFGVYPTAAQHIVGGGELRGNQLRLPNEDFWRPPEKNVDHVKPIPQKYLDKVPILATATDDEANACKEYLIWERRIHPSAIALSGVRYYSPFQAIAFPYTDISGEIYSIRVRLRREKKFFFLTSRILGRKTSTSTLSENGAWFGLGGINWTRPIMIVESETDRLRLMSLGGDNILASGGTSITEAQVRALFGTIYYLGLDADKAGKAATESLIRRIKGAASIYLLDWGLVNCKDGGDLTSRNELDSVIRSMRKA